MSQADVLFTLRDRLGCLVSYSELISFRDEVVDLWKSNKVSSALAFPLLQDIQAKIDKGGVVNDSKRPSVRSILRARVISHF